MITGTLVRLLGLNVSPGDHGVGILLEKLAFYTMAPRSAQTVVSPLLRSKT